ncbi:MAG: archease [Candidatus Omnitrophica bacterium]|nr:archease [Candidatus Omnitrophota bacterium]
MAHHKFSPLKNYEIIEHTADIGIKVKGVDLKELFRNAAVAMFDISSEKIGAQAGKEIKIEIKQESGSLEELFVNWLNELLSLSAAKELIFSGFQINTINKNTLQAEVTGEDTANYKVNTEIKAATYHQLIIGQDKTGWHAEVIFDV